jgi:hypothetical protein
MIKAFWKCASRFSNFCFSYSVIGTKFFFFFSFLVGDGLSHSGRIIHRVCRLLLPVVKISVSSTWRASTIKLLWEEDPEIEVEKRENRDRFKKGFYGLVNFYVLGNFYRFTFANVTLAGGEWTQFGFFVWILITLRTFIDSYVHWFIYWLIHYVYAALFCLTVCMYVCM